MKKTVTALMVILPLVFLIALFAITSATSVSADIPVSGIAINNKGDNDGVFYFDIANYSPMYEEELEIEVLPYKAKNRNYTLTVTDENTGNPTDIVSVNQENGAFELHNVGMARLTYTTDDGGYSDSIIFNIDSSGILDFTPTLSDSQDNAVELQQGTNTDYVANITTGSYVFGGNYHPSTTTMISPKYSVEEGKEGNITLNETSGKFTAYYQTSTTVYMSVVGANNQTITKSIKLNIEKPQGSSATINGQHLTEESVNVTTIHAPLHSKKFSIYLDLTDGLTEDDIIIATFDVGYEEEITKLDDVSDSSYRIDITLDDAVEDEDIVINWIIYVGTSEYHFDVAYADYSFAINSTFNKDGKSEDLVLIKGDSTNLTISCEPDADLSYEWSIYDTSFAKVTSQNGDVCTIEALKDGETTLTVKWSTEDGRDGEVTRNIIVTTAYKSLVFSESLGNYGLGSLAIANHKYDNGQIKDANYCATLFNNIVGGRENVTSFKDITFTSSNESVVEVKTTNGIEFVIKDNGTVTITAKWNFASIFGAEETSLTFTAVDGVYVSTYDELMDATSKDKQIVLANDIYLGENLFDVDASGKRSAKYSDAVMKEKLLSFTKEINTTFDSQYYKNIYGEDYQAKVRYCVEFTRSVYGNGHMINAEYITQMIDSTGHPYDYAVFQGPLNFVAAKWNGVPEIASVKGQDNICFLVRTDGVELNNLVLASCDDESLYDNDTMELTLLDYTGTTLEIMSDVDIVNCRIKNGRTVVRAHGRYDVDLDSEVNAEKEKINVTIEHCILQNAREFILKIGTNRVKRGYNVDDAAGPSLYDGNGKEYTAYNSPACDNYINDAYFMNNYVLTDVTLKDSTLSTSGLFAVGMESHFAGGMLDGVAFLNLEGWENLAATSYPAILHLVGNVVLDNWKELSTVNSETLITTNIDKSQAENASLAFLTLNVAEMLKAVKSMSQGTSYQNIITTIGEENYVHGGIAFYGGGKNYSILDTSEYTFEKMNQYNINISILSNCEDATLKRQGDYLPYAAGSKDFRFVMFDSTSKYSPAK